MVRTRAGARLAAARLALALVASAVAGLQACGLEEIIVLSPPDYYAIADGALDYFKIRIDGDNDEFEFRGIEIYYRFYDPADLARPPQVGLATQAELTAAGFRRLSSTSDRLSLIEYPLIPVPTGDQGDSAQITVDFSPLGLDPPGQPFLTAVPDVAGNGLEFGPTEFRRGVIASNNQFYKTFYHETDAELGFKSNDADIAHLSFAPGQHEVYIALYALSYGKQDLATTVYSRAVPLQYITVWINVVA